MPDLPNGIVGRAVAIPDHMGDDGGAMVGDDDDVEAVGEPRLRDGGAGGGRHRGGARVQSGLRAGCLPRRRARLRSGQGTSGSSLSWDLSLAEKLAPRLWPAAGQDRPDLESVIGFSKAPAAELPGAPRPQRRSHRLAHERADAGRDRHGERVQKATRSVGFNMPAPPMRAPSAPRTPRQISDIAKTAGASTACGARIAVSSGTAAPAAKVAADVSAAWIGRAEEDLRNAEFVPGMGASARPWP